MRGISALPILLLLGTAAAPAPASRSGTGRMSRSGTGRMSRTLGTGRMSRTGTGRMSRTLGRNYFLQAQRDQLAVAKRYYLIGSTGAPLHIKIKNGLQKWRGVKTQFSRSLPVKEAEKSLMARIRQKIIEQGVLQALGLDLGYNPGSIN